MNPKKTEEMLAKFEDELLNETDKIKINILIKLFDYEK